MSSNNDRSLVACLRVQDAPHLRPLANTIEAMAFALKDQVQARSNTVDRMNPVSAASMIDMLYEIYWLTLLGRADYKLWTDARRAERARKAGAK